MPEAVALAGSPPGPLGAPALRVAQAPVGEALAGAAQPEDACLCICSLSGLDQRGSGLVVARP